jgi:exonuclease III
VASADLATDPKARAASGRVHESRSIRWRIDYQIATPGLAALAREARVERAVDHPSRWSDHALVTVMYGA